MQRVPQILIPAFEVTGTSSQQDVIGMPVKTEDGGADRLLDVLAHPPVDKQKAGSEGSVLTNQTQHFM